MRSIEACQGAAGRMEKASAAKTTKVTVETETLLIICHTKAVRGWCPECGAEVNLIALDDSSLADHGSMARIRELFVTGKAHSWRSADGSIQICLTSLVGHFESSEARSISHWIENQLSKIRRKK